MKILLSSIAILFAVLFVHAEDADETTISIKKGLVQPATKYEINEGTEDIAGEANVLKKTAEKNWKTACSEWSKELKQNHKEGQLISHGCGKMICTKEGVESTCSSKAKYKVRVLVQQ